MKQKKAQLEVTFHWVYILIAGAVILLFFVGIVMRGKVVAEERLGEDVVRIMESILVGAGVAEKTKNFVKTEGLADYVIEFKCEEGYAGFGIKGGAFREVPMNPVFAPKEVKTTELILWSLPYKMPYKVMDLLMVTSINTKYFVIGGEGTFFRGELEKSVEDLKNFDLEISDLSEIDPGKNFHVRIVDLDGINIKGQPVPEKLKEMGDKQVSAVSFSGVNQVTYFQKKGAVWEEEETVQIISIAEEKDAAKYAAIFAGDGESYRCNMIKVFKRMNYVNEVYWGKFEEIVDYYKENPLGTSEECLFILERQTTSMWVEFGIFKAKTSYCVLDYDYCSDLIGEATNLKNLNTELGKEPCITLY